MVHDGGDSCSLPAGHSGDGAAAPHDAVVSRQQPDSGRDCRHAAAAHAGSIHCRISHRSRCSTFGGSALAAVTRAAAAVSNTCCECSMARGSSSIRSSHNWTRHKHSESNCSSRQQRRNLRSIGRPLPTRGKGKGTLAPRETGVQIATSWLADHGSSQLHGMQAAGSKRRIGTSRSGAAAMSSLC